MIVNTLLAAKAFDPFPFILLNLVLSCIAAIQAPLIMMSQNRQEEKDRRRAENDYKVNLKTEIMIEDIYDRREKRVRCRHKFLNAALALRRPFIIVKPQYHETSVCPTGIRRFLQLLPDHHNIVILVIYRKPVFQKQLTGRIPRRNIVMQGSNSVFLRRPAQ